MCINLNHFRIHHFVVLSIAKYLMVNDKSTPSASTLVYCQVFALSQPPSRLLGSPALCALALYALTVYSLAAQVLSTEKYKAVYSAVQLTVYRAILQSISQSISPSIQRPECRSQLAKRDLVSVVQHDSSIVTQPSSLAHCIFRAWWAPDDWVLIAAYEVV